ncbi:MAG: glycosyltransferase [Chloroflexota bacterium]
MLEVSVVVITRNQEWNVPRLIESVLSKASPFLSIDVILVDSASTDKTVGMACAYPINIISLAPDQRLTAAAGRYVGYNHTSGQFVLFLDGDMELSEGWLEQALEILLQDPRIAVVTGELIDRPKLTPYDIYISSRAPRETAPVVDVPHGGGAALYRRSVLKEVGTFNPYLYSDEEPDLCVRIRHKGYRVVKLTSSIALHYTDPDNQISTLFARWKRRLYLGAGQNLRYHLGSELFIPYLKERGFGLAPAGGVLVGVASLALTTKTHRFRWFGLWLASWLGVIGFYTARKKSLYRAIHSLLLRFLIMDGTIRGFLLTPYRPETCPIRFTVVKTAGKIDYPPLRENVT